MTEFFSLEALRTVAGQVAAIALLTEALKRVFRLGGSATGPGGSAPRADWPVQVLALAAGVGLNVVFVAWGQGGAAYVLAVLNGLGVGLAAMKGVEFVRGRG